MKLNIGAGDTKLEGFTPVDRKLGSEVYPLKYGDNEAEEIRASHILEHFSHREARKALHDWVRVLKQGGRIRISVPDIEKINLNDDKWPFYLMGGQTDENDFHKSAFNEPRLRKYMEDAGLKDIKRWESDNCDTASNPVSCNLEGVKREASSGTVKIAALLSIPRVGWNDHWGCVMESLRPFEIPVHRFNGVFWGQCMQRGMQKMVDDGVDWVLTLDYDTVFSKYHVDKMLGWFGQRPEIDALAALQSRRQMDTPLMTVGKQGEAEVDGTPLKVTTAHFGLTLLRVESLADVKKPWFFAQPNKNGEWGDGRMDDDIWFWHQWRLAEKTIYVAPDVRIGHLELMVSDFDDHMNHRLRTMPEWRESECTSSSKEDGKAISQTQS